MKRILITECKQLQKGVDGEESAVLGSCGEHFIKCRLFELIADVARVTDPPGLVKFALEWTAEVIEEIPDFIFAHTSVSNVLTTQH